MRAKYIYITKQAHKYLLVVVLMLSVFFTGCEKFLDEKPNQADIIPTSLDDLRSLLDNAVGNMNSRGSGGYAELLSDNIYVLDPTWQNAASSSIPKNQSEAQNYIWGNLSYEDYWKFPYAGPIYYSNIVLDQLPLLKRNAGDGEKYDNIKGSALFYRAFAFHGMAQLFCKPYSTEYANEPGIVLRLTSNASEKSSRATVQQTYDRIIADLKEAVSLLPATTTYLTRPSKTAAYAALARIYLAMRDYTNAGQYANLVLQQYSTLIDYNTLLPVGSPPIISQNAEVIFHNYSPTVILLNNANNRIDSTLYQSYDANDMRKTVFFRPNGGAYSFRGSYNGSLQPVSVFDGLATDEMYLIRAECAARAGNKDAALTDLNTLMANRWSNNGTWTLITATDATDALEKILIERRKELVFRGLRWSDIRRLNVEGANITLKRVIAGTTYTLPPNDLRSVMLIPFSELNNNPNVQQNPR